MKLNQKLILLENYLGISRQKMCMILLGLLILALAVNRSRRSTEEVAGRDR